MATASERLTEQFYAWEERGRGTYTFPVPVELEPHFVPFTGHYLPNAGAVTDDSRKKGLVGTLASLFRTPQQEEPQEETGIAGVPVEEDAPLRAIGVTFPKDADIDMRSMEQLLTMLSYTEYPVSFEVHGTTSSVFLQLVCREPDYDTVHAHVRAYFPEARLTEIETDAVQDGGENAPTIFVDFCLSDEFMLPLRMVDKSEPDTLIGIVSALEILKEDECATLQILFHGAIQPWADSVMRAITDSKGKPFFTNAPDTVKQAKEKVSASLFAVSIRICATAETAERARNIAFSVGKAVVRITKSECNSLAPLASGSKAAETCYADMVYRISHRSGMLLNVTELLTLVRFPSPEVTSAKLERDTRKTKAAPSNTTGAGCVIGMNTHHGEGYEVSIPPHMRLRHTHVIGATGTGKSTLLLSMIGQDMRSGNGVAVLDPHGDLIEAILAHVPEERIKDVIIIDPADADFPVGFNILSAHSEQEKEILSSDLVAAFKRLSTSWGDQMNSVFANAILAFLESTEVGTLAELRRFLIEKPYRERYLQTVADPNIVYYWQHEYPLLKSSSIGSILTRLDSFLRPKLIRNMVAQKKSLDFEDILDSKKILLVKLSQGLIGAENSFLLGTFFVTKMYQAATARQAKAKADRGDYFLYIDEFQNYIAPSISHILSGARKYGLGLILAHQDMQQLVKYDSELANSVVTNAGTRICFRLGDTDAKRFANGFSYFDAADLENLKTGEAIARIEQPNFDFNLSTIPLPEVSEDEATARRTAVISHSREKHGTPKEIVEKSFEHVHEVPKEPIQKPVPPPQAEAHSVPHEPPREQITVEEVRPAEHTPLAIRKTPKPETRHRSLQTLIKRIAQSRGYKASIEEVTPDGKGKVDVSLERDGRRIACEVSVTTTDVWEVHNVEKCLAAGYDQVIVCSEDKKHLYRIREQLEKRLDASLQTKVLTLEPEEMVRYFDMQAVREMNAETVIRGYKVKVEYDTSSTEDVAKKQERIMQTVAKSIRVKK